MSILKWFAELILRKEIEELHRWRCYSEEYARWLSEFRHVSSIMDNMKGQCQGDRPYRSIQTFREELRKLDKEGV